MKDIFESLRGLVQDRMVSEASDEAKRIASISPDVCFHSSEFLSLLSRVCAWSRQWGKCQILSHQALLRDNFEHEESLHWAETLFAFTAGCDLVLRVIPESRPSARNKTMDKIVFILDWFNDAKKLDTKTRAIGREFELEFLMMVSGYMPLPPRVGRLVRRELILLRSWLIKKRGKRSEYRSLTERINQLNHSSLDAEEGVKISDHWIVQIDASEVGNEARYANHADIPNAVLARRCTNPCKPSCELSPNACTQRYPHLVALRDIKVNQEITINYGSSYWNNCGPGVDIESAGKYVTEPFTDCIYYNGILEDFQCSSAPGGFLIPPHANKKRKRQTDILEVRQVDSSHPAFPGFGLYAKKIFSRGETICLYAGIVDMSPFSARHTSKYAVDLSSETVIGPFGFELDSTSLKCIRTQRGWPFVVNFADISIAPSSKILSGLKQIGDLNEELSRKIIDALLDEQHKELIRKKIQLCETAHSEKMSKRELDAWTKKVTKLFSDPFKPIPNELVKEEEDKIETNSKSLLPLEEFEDPELIVLLG